MLGFGRRKFIERLSLRFFGSVSSIIESHRFTGQRTAALIKRFKLRGVVEARAMLRRFRELEQGALRQEALGIGGRLNPQTIAINRSWLSRHGIQARIGYEIRVGIRDLATGVVIDARTIFIESDVPLTNAELFQQAGSQLLEFKGTSPTLDDFLSNVNSENIDFDVIGVFRDY